MRIMTSLERASHPAHPLGVWHLPVVNEYLQQLESDFPDAWHLLYTIHDRIWVTPQSVRSKSNANILDEISHLASILKSSPRLFLGSNVLMRDRGFRVHCQHDAAEVEYFVFITPSSSTILSTIEGNASESESLMHLRATLFTSDHPFDKIIAGNPSVSWMTCIAELLQVELDGRRPMSSSYRRKIFHCLRMLTKRSIIPPSLFLSNIIKTEGHPLSWGGFANIHQGKIGDVTVCLKVLRMFDFSPDARKTSTAYKEFALEALIWRQLDHPNILPMLGVSDEIYAPFLCLVSPYMQNGNIISFLKQHPEHDRFTSILEVVAGITYLHALDPPITHKDIKGANILVKDDGQCCLADFGLSSAYGSQNLTTTSHFKGSVRWLAPELIAPGRFPDHVAGLPGDIYALACTIYEIYTGKPPLSHLATDVAVIQAVILENKRESLPPTPSSMWGNRERRLWLLVDECWYTLPSERPDITFINKVLMEIRDSQHDEDIHDGPMDVSISESANSDQPMLDIHGQGAYSSTNVGRAKLNDTSLMHDCYKGLIAVSSSPSWLTSIAELLQVGLSDSNLVDSHRRRALHHLLKLSHAGILPNSYFLKDVRYNPEKFMEDDDTYAEEFKGSFGGKPVYVKFLKDKSPSVRHTKLSRKFILRQVVIQRQLNHPNIVPFLGLSEQVISGVSGIYSISLWLNNRNLIDFVEWYPRHDKFKSICETVEAVNYIHHFNPPIIHGDINGWRIIVSDKYKCYLSGFCLAQVDGIDGIRDHLENAFTRRGVYYLAPEYANEMAREAQLRRSADIFSLACTIYQVYTGKSPFADIEVDNTPLAVRSGWRPIIPPPGDWTVQEFQLWSLVDLCWDQDPDGRPTIQEISSMLLNIETTTIF